MTKPISIPSVSVKYAQDGSSTRSNALGMRPMQERVWQKRGEQYLLIKSPPASGKSRALMFVALDKLTNQKLRQAIIVVPEKAIGASFHDEPLSQFGFWADWHVEAFDDRLIAVDEFHHVSANQTAGWASTFASSWRATRRTWWR